MNDEQATIPEDQEVNEEGQEEAEESQAAIPAEGEDSEDITQEEQQQVNLVEALTKSGSIPKGVEPFQDEEGALKFVMPINGQKYIVNFNQLISGFNLNQAGEQKLREGKELEKNLNKLLKDLSPENPDSKKELRKFLQKMGHNLGDLGEEFLNEVVEEQQMTPQERELRQRIADVEEREAKLKEAEMTEQEKMQRAERTQKQEAYTKEIITALESRIDKDIDPVLKQKLFIKVTQEMMDAFRIERRISAEQALDNVLTEYDLLLEQAAKLYGKEHLKKRIPAEFKKLINGLTLEEKEQMDIISNSVQGGAVDLEDFEDKRKPIKKKKTLLSEWQPKI